MELAPLPGYLSQPQAQGIVLGEPIAQYEQGSGRNFVYLILDWSTRKAAWVDPQADVDRPWKELQSQGFELSHLFLTHTHFDHVAGVPELHRRFPQLPIWVGAEDAYRLAKLNLGTSIRTFCDGMKIPVGSLSVQALHTPGHSPGEYCLMLDAPSQNFLPRPYLLTGDTLFIRDCGRTDFEGGSEDQMYLSLQKIKTLPQETILLPGHHYAPECATTLGRELNESPPLRCRSVEELRALP